MRSALFGVLLAILACAPLAAWAGPQSVQITDKSGANTAPVDSSTGVTVNCVMGCAAPSVTPVAGANSATSAGAVNAVNAPSKGCYLQNPLTAGNQGIGVAEDLFVNPVTTATTVGNGTTADLAPGQSYNCPPGMTTALSVIANTSGHKFTVVSW